LNEHGISQAEEFGRTFRNREISGIFSSDMARAIQTARIISDITGIRYMGSNPGFRERGCGEISGLDYFGIEKKFGIQLKSILSRDLDNIPGAEKYADFTARSQNAVYDIFRRASGEDVCVITHGGVMAYLHQWTSGTDELVRFGNCGMMWIGMSEMKVVNLGGL
jgi:broad specificity phosphatase PhoE